MIAQICPITEIWSRKLVSEFFSPSKVFVVVDKVIATLRKRAGVNSRIFTGEWGKREAEGVAEALWIEVLISFACGDLDA